MSTAAQRMFPAGSLSAAYRFPEPQPGHALTFRITDGEARAGATARCTTCGRFFRDAEDAESPCEGEP